MVATLAKRNEELEGEIASLRETVTFLQAKLESTEQERQLLARLLKNLRGLTYGKTSEKLAPGQQAFDFLGELVEEATSELEQEIEDEQPDDKPKRKPKRRKPDSIPDSVERERIELDVERARILIAGIAQGGLDPEIFTCFMGAADHFEGLNTDIG